MNKTFLATLIIALMSTSVHAKIGSGSKSSGTRFSLKRESTVSKIASRNYEKPSLPPKQAPKPTVIAQQTSPATGGFSVNTQKSSDPIAPSTGTIGKSSSASTYGSNRSYRSPSSGIDAGDATIIALQAAQLALEMKRHNDPVVSSNQTPSNPTATASKPSTEGVKSGIGSFFMSLVWIVLAVSGILILINAAYFVYRMMRKEQGITIPATTPETTTTQPMEFKTMDPTIQRQQTVRTEEEEDILRQKGPSFYKEFQQAVENNNVTYVQQHTTPEMFDEVQQAMQGEQHRTVINKVDVEDVYDIRYQQGVFYASIHFTGYFSYANEPDSYEAIDEVWHVVRNEQNEWKVAGLDTLA